HDALPIYLVLVLGGGGIVDRAGGDRDDPRRDRVWIHRRLGVVGAVISRGEDNDDAAVVQGAGGDVDGMVGVEGLVGGAPRVVDHADAPLGMVEDLVEGRERADDQQHLAGGEADEVGAGSHPRQGGVGRAVGGDDPG